MTTTHKLYMRMQLTPLIKGIVDVIPGGYVIGGGRDNDRFSVIVDFGSSEKLHLQ